MAAALGPVAGLGAARVVASHFSVIVRGTAQLFVAGPPVVAAAMGETPDKEELGGARAQTRAGAVDNEAADEDDALGAAAPLPLLSAAERVGGAARRRRAPTRRDRREEDLLSIVPRERRRPYKARRILEAVLDAGSLFEVGAAFGRPPDHGTRPPRRAAGRRAVLGPEPLRRRPDRGRVREAHAVRRRVRPVPPAGRELRRPAGVRDRHRGRAPRHDPARHARARRRLPGDGAVGVGARAQGLRRRRRRARPGADGLNLRYAWPSGDWGSLPIEGGIEAAYRRELEAADDPVALRAEIEERLNAVRSPVPHGGALRRRGDHRPARHAPAAVRLGRARSRARALRGLHAARSAAACGLAD